MLKLIPSGGAAIQPPTALQPMVTDPVIVEIPPSEPIPAYEVSFMATKPQTIAWAIPLSWKKAVLARPEVLMSSGVKDWCNYSTLFSNWLYSALTVFLAVSAEELTIPVPDQFIDDLDVTGLTLSKEYEKGGNMYIKIYA
jgi:hypothetical protein